ncbi:hypothetical protein D9M69_391310 [compost metagenome]
MAQATFLQLLVDVFHRCIVVGQHCNRLSTQQDIGEDVEDGLGLAGPRWALDHANLRAEGLLDRRELALVQSERIDQPLARRQRAVVPRTIGVQGGVGTGGQFCQLAHDIRGDLTVSLRLGLILPGIRHG